MFCFVRYFVTGKAKHLIFRRHCDPLASGEAIPNYTGRRERCRTCIAALPVGDCFVPDAGLIKEESHSFPNGFFFFKILILVS